MKLPQSEAVSNRERGRALSFAHTLHPRNCTSSLHAPNINSCIPPSARILFLNVSTTIFPFDKQGWTDRVSWKFSFRPSSQLEIFLYSDLGHSLIDTLYEPWRGALDKLAEVVLQKKPKDCDQKSSYVISSSLKSRLWLIIRSNLLS